MIEASVKIGIIAALAAEARPLGGVPPPGGDPAALPDGSRLSVSGMGFDAAAASARRLLDAGCGALVSWGMAGGLDPALSAGAIVVPDAIACDGEPPLSVAPAGRERILHHLAAAPLGARTAISGGKLMTSRRALVSPVEKSDAFHRSGAVAVDMESYAIAQEAASRGVPFLCIRAVVDTAADEVPRAVADAADAHGRLAIGRLTALVLAAPGSIAPLVRLACRYRLARSTLRDIARIGALRASIA